MREHTRRSQIVVVQDGLGVPVLRLALLRQKNLLDLARVSWKYRIKR
jgi:hypothetical protein